MDGGWEGAENQRFRGVGNLLRQVVGRGAGEEYQMSQAASDRVKYFTFVVFAPRDKHSPSTSLPHRAGVWRFREFSVSGRLGAISRGTIYLGLALRTHLRKPNRGNQPAQRAANKLLHSSLVLFVNSNTSINAGERASPLLPQRALASNRQISDRRGRHPPNSTVIRLIVGCP